MQQPEYDSSDDEDDEDDDDDVSPKEEETEVEAAASLLPQVQQLGRGLRVRKQRSRYVPGTSEFTDNNVKNVRNNQGHFSGPGFAGTGVVNMT